MASYLAESGLLDQTLTRWLNSGAPAGKKRKLFSASSQPVHRGQPFTGSTAQHQILSCSSGGNWPVTAGSVIGQLPVGPVTEGAWEAELDLRPKSEASWQTAEFENQGEGLAVGLAELEPERCTAQVQMDQEAFEYGDAFQLQRNEQQVVPASCPPA
ncbi:unnamed protein product [Polarella glacialis]|uniref:Uncharacterized protein n=1 Tax=Polarella glacialis TaxID=89957 RepID=A0A813G3B2_POLGL|nr:unnamed protein product [Polarella glacialis]